MNFSKFEEKIGVKFKDKNLLQQAFTHRSYLNENPSLGLEQNERLEFLGDAVLELAITEYLYKKYPKKTEGEMTALRAALVNSITLSETASELNIGDFMLLSKGEAKSLGKARQYILANAFEALIGAIYLNGGYEETFDFLEKNLFGKIEEVIEKKLWIDAKSLFQEKVQELESVTPSYKVLAESGPDHEKVFTMGVFLGDKLMAEGKGASKQEAEQDAARKALKTKNWRKE
ncbi:MAG: ribonuclease III [Candidatus Terrybacteria bacterium RIFCSPHIGHO2_02_41_19]|uniref:Ribonuclease 3 n=1 Tax=Candidatus Terrybacteria bacterium RIFCSPHIGHO2_02_41_19 TaxID=1802364 RepID=A0A1G2PP74_9BACT|nr:MAG: ribonuclease III [Candidatus Terrybacteria bacterium RIFCSPHIGHO2_02_41_19]